ncbi:MAG: branched-chain amino acid transaminase [Nitrospirae bacterium]|nr:branched-chain amino acid transaminase [Nitrospirota bacterium]
MKLATEKIWMDGKFINWNDATVHIMTHTLHYGLGLFEGIRCYKVKNGSAVFRLKEHIKRLFDSAHIFQLKIPFTEEEVMNAVIETIKINKLAECYIRPLVYVGYGAMGIDPKDNPIRLAIAVWPWGSYLGDDGLKNGIRVKTSSFIRGHVNSVMQRAKVTGYYATTQLAKKEALSMGFDEALLLDPEGFVAEGAGENIFIVRNGELKTTTLTSILEGITRDSVITLAHDLGIALREERFTRDEVYISDEAFFTGTAAEVTPIRELDGRPIGKSCPGEITKKIQSVFFDAVWGKLEKYHHWLTFLK